MNKNKGNIGVTTENIFPVIKKFLYSDHEIFLRELVSNAVDAIQKLKTLQLKGECSDDTSNLIVNITLDKKKGTLTVSDNGIGMTADEIDRYINQIAFSGANDFLEKYKDDANAIIGHFGLGFYSAFMVAKKVEIVSRSYRPDAPPVHWSCEGTPEFTMEESKKSERGTDIILHIDDDSREFLEEERISTLLAKYCRFLPVPIAFGKKKEWKDGKQVETEEDNIINDTNPLWTRTPSDLKDEDYRKFYSQLYPMSDEPLFWIHLNVDYPFHLTGILYFPRVKSNIDLQRNKIQLFCNQVFVTDSVEDIVPDFLTLLHGVIDSPDIPLNVSRSYLQSDANVKKISTYITKKVSDRLQSIFKENRKEFEEKWDNLKIFINYGMLTQDDFYDKAEKYALLKDTDDKYYTYDEYRTLVKENQTDKEDTLVYLYAANKEEQYTYIQAAEAKGYNVLLMDGQLDVPMVGLFERKFEKCCFARVDADVLDRLIKKDDVDIEELDAEIKFNLSHVFESQMPHEDKKKYHVESSRLGETQAPVLIMQSEYMRRMKEMAAIEPGMGFYGEMPDMYSVMVNADHRLVKKVMEEKKEACEGEIAPLLAENSTLRARQSEIEESHKGKKDDEIPVAEKEELTGIKNRLEEIRHQREEILANFAAGNTTVHQLIDLALLQNGMLKGEALARFVARSIEVLE